VRGGHTFSFGWEDTGKSLRIHCQPPVSSKLRKATNTFAFFHEKNSVFRPEFVLTQCRAAAKTLDMGAIAASGEYVAVRWGMFAA
jgi:hypothetical protein